jgi:heat shock protein HslJ
MWHDARPRDQRYVQARLVAVVVACIQGETVSPSTRLRPVWLTAVSLAGILVLVAACSSDGGASTAPSTAPGGGDITGTWQLVAATTTKPASQGVVPAADQDRYVITFNEDGSTEIQADCNRIRGDYETTADGGLTITLGPSTLVACPEGSLGPQFADSLARRALHGS